MEHCEHDWQFKCNELEGTDSRGQALPGTIVFDVDRCSKCGAKRREMLNQYTLLMNVTT